MRKDESSQHFYFFGTVAVNLLLNNALIKTKAKPWVNNDNDMFQILAPVGKVVFTDPFQAAAREAKNLNEMGIDVIILLSHCGYDIDM